MTSKLRGGRLALLLAMLVAVGFSSIAAADHNTAELISTGTTGGSEASHAFFRDATSDGSKVFFDVDPEGEDGGRSDVYQRSGGVTTLISTGPHDGLLGASFSGASADGTRVFFKTDDKLVGTDTDSSDDIYERSGGTTTLISQGTTNGNLPLDAQFAGNSTDGSKVFFVTQEALVAEDTDGDRFDVYERAGTTTTLISPTPSGGDPPLNAAFEGASDDGSRVFFSTSERLLSDDTDGRSDIYARSGATLTLVSESGADTSFDAEFETNSSDGSRVIFKSQESIDINDTDEGRNDIYQWSSGAPAEMTLVSIGAITPSNGQFEALFDGASKDGTRVFFHTDEQLVALDNDNQDDIYEWSASGLTKISPGNEALRPRFLLTSDDGSVVLFDTVERVLNNNDGLRDIFATSAGSVTLESAGGSDDVDVCFHSFEVRCEIRLSNDGRIFFHTAAKLLPGDTDDMFDIYERSGGVTTMLPSSSGAPNLLSAISDNGDLVFFESQAQLAAGDTDGNFQDIYQARFVQPSVTPPGTGTGTGIGGTPPAASSGTPNLTVKTSARKTQRILGQGGVVVSFVCNNACQGSATGSINVPGASKVFRLGKASKSAAANKTTTLKLKLAKKARSAIKRALKRGKSLRAKVKLTVKDGSGSKTSSLTVRLKR